MDEALVKQATEYLGRRYDEEALRYPLMRDTVTREGYIRVNLPFAVRNIRNRNLGASDKPAHQGTVLP